MKKASLNTLAFIVLLAFTACKKQNSIVTPTPISSVNLVNAASDAAPLIPDFGGSPVQWYAGAQSIAYGSSLEYSIPSGSNVSLTVVQSSDTADNLIDGTFSLGADKIYSLFVCGTVTPGGHANADYLLLQDSIPYYPAADSVIGIRYIDLLSDGGNISVNQQGNAVGSEVAGLPYKNSTGFKTYPATSNISGYVFEIRDATSQTLLTTFTLSSFVLYKNITLVIAGSGDNPQDAVVTAFQVNNY